MKRLIPFALIMVSGAWMYACSSDEPTPNNSGAEEDGGGGGGDNDGSAPGEDGGPGGDDDDDGGPGNDGSTPGNGNPIDGIAAPKVIAEFPGMPFVAGPQWHPTSKVFYITAPFAGTGTDGQIGLLQTVTLDGAFAAAPLRFGDGTTTGVLGTSIDKAGTIISTERKKLTRTSATGTVTDITVGYTGDAGAGTFDTPKDLVARLSDNTIFFTDPGYITEPPMGINHLFKVSPTGVTTVLDSYPDVPRPNGIALTKDEKTLYVGFTSPSVATPTSPSVPYIRAYTVNADGTVKDAKKFVELPAASDPDGLAVDEAGNVYVAFKAGVNVYKPDGTKLGTGAASIPFPEQVNGVAFGGEDRKTLLVTANKGKIYTVTVKIAGVAQ